jgi:hypothetical protein
LNEQFRALLGCVAALIDCFYFNNVIVEESQFFFGTIENLVFYQIRSFRCVLPDEVVFSVLTLLHHVN